RQQGKPLHFIFVFQNCDLIKQSIVHVVQTPQENSQKKMEVDNAKAGGGLGGMEREPESLTRVDLSTSILPSYSAGLAVILDTTDDSASSYNSFYVFCKSFCHAVKPGKLRVHCSTCKQGTLTLSRGPGCWNQLSGSTAHQNAVLPL
uniref:Parkin RING/Ubox like zinc-binding domain-containing protein n=1 Tax=Sphenodon punctatus TaxID=8508 RepID=A0A8D0GYG3_SPHPU